MEPLNSLQNYLLRIGHILPPIIVDSIFSPSHAWEVIEPPFVVRADFSAAPF
jgi:hypothetical protein